MENELATATRMVELLQRHLKDAEDRVAQAESARDAASKRAADAKAQAESERSRLEAAVAAVKADCEKVVAQLQEQLQHVQQQAAERHQRSLGRSSSGSSSTAVPVELEGVASVELVDKLVRAERELGRERTERQRLEVYLTRISEDIQAKAPIIAGQKQDYRRALQVLLAYIAINQCCVV
jgi:ATPase subunit of ABC transporter with duplicated ATPase domains